MRPLKGILALMLIGLTAGAAEPPGVPPPYRVGQVWHYHARPGEEESLLKIQAIERDPAYAALAPIYHISVIGVQLGGRGGATRIFHLPVSRQTLDASVTEPFQGSAVFPSADGGIAEWRRAKGGVFTITIAEIVDHLDQTVRSQMGATGSARKSSGASP